MYVKKAVIALIVLATLAVIWSWGATIFEIDQCLDNGGRLNYETRQCEME